MTIQTFIEKAIEGGWIKTPAHNAFDGRNYLAPCIEKILLDPDAWKAVGKACFWEEFRAGEDEVAPMTLGVRVQGEAWLFNMHRMIDALAEGKTIEQYLETL